MKNMSISFLILLLMSNPVWAKSKKYSKYKESNTTTTQYQPTTDKTCHIGPRGGRYTITASGNKRYGC